MDRSPTNRSALASGIFFIAAGTVFLLDRLGAFDLRARYLAPLVLIGLGLAMVLGGRWRGDANP